MPKNKRLFSILFLLLFFGVIFWGAGAVSVLAATDEDNDTTASQDCSGSSATGTCFPNPLKYSSVDQVVQALLNNLRGIMATIAIAMIVVGGVFYITSAGNDNQIKRSKTIITSALIGLVIVLAAPSLIKEVYTILGGKSGSAEVEGAITLKAIVLNVLKFLLSVVGLLGIIALTWGGVKYLSSRGDQRQIDEAKKVITAAVIGIAVAFGALVLVKQIGTLLGVS